MDFQKITAFLEKFKALEKSRTAILEEIAGTVARITKTSIKPNNIEYKNGTVYVKESPATKSTVFIKKEEIIGELKKKLPKTRILDIK